MKLVLFAHPSFVPSESMPRFLRMLRDAYLSEGYGVEVWSPRPVVYSWLRGSRLAKWGGYIDQYLLFPRFVRRELRRTPRDTLFVFCDQALGPWVPLVRDRPNVVHVHDLLALRSALGEFPEHRTAITGRLYQRYIRRGFRQARHFICISQNTREDLHRYGGVKPETCDVVYNGLNFPYRRLGPAEARDILRAAQLPDSPHGMLLHVGNGQWYKNQPGLIRLYAAYAASTPAPLPLWCISPQPDNAMRSALNHVPAVGNVRFFQRLDNRTLQAAYSTARALLFPSLAEGFGWPLIEAQACGCPVLTTDAPPMNEIAGSEAVYIPRLQAGDEIAAWAERSATALISLLDRSDAETVASATRSQLWARRFDAADAIAGYMRVYRRILGETADVFGAPVSAA